MRKVSLLLETPLSESFRGRDFLSLHDYTTEELFHIMRLASSLKAQRNIPLLEGKTLGMIFAKSSTRTRVSFEVGMFQLGGYALFLNQQDIQLGRGETIADTARVLSRYLDGIMIRTFAHEDVEELARYSTIPVINGLTDLLHPCQALADYLTVYERFGKLEGLKLAFIGDGNNVAHSLMFGAAKFGVDFVIACPEGYEPDLGVLAKAREDAEKTGASIDIVREPKEAVHNADVLYTDVWASMGQEEEQKERQKAFCGYQINQELLDVAAADAIVLHCLPAHRGEEITDEVMEGPHSAIFDEAENRLHVQKAIMALIMKGERK
ncbi:MAG TPA: ornithine carbamoyltransferase [Bacillota bacterium]|nr:ornithine carbamoyltransferase [Bacillota bacterium]